MNKKLLLVLIGVGMAVGANADLTKFRWYNTAANNLVDNGSVAAPVGTTVLTYLSANNSVDYVGGLLSASIGDDTFYQALGTSLSGRLTTSYMVETVNDYRGMYAYAIILNMPLTTFTGTYGGNVASVPSGTYYAITGVSVALANMNIEPPPTAQTFTSGNLAMTQTIPEPATALLFGIGGMGAWVLRRSKIKSQEEGEEADA